MGVMTDDKLVARLGEKMDVVARLLALQVCMQLRSGDKKEEKKKQIEMLSASGLDRNAIAAVVGTTPGTVSVRQSEAKKKAAK